MKRRDFFKKSAVGLAATGVAVSTVGCTSSDIQAKIGDRSTDQWNRMDSGKKDIPKRQQTLDFDVAVIGGGMSGICAAVAAARNGAKTVLVQDRPVLGGNASSEMRVTVNQGSHKERESGIIEEILIENWVYNPQDSYPVWDHVLYGFVKKEKNLKVMMNMQAIGVNMAGSKIESAVCWGLTNETEFTIKAKQFIDCSGDGLLAAKAGAEYRTGRESRSEFGESHAPEQADGWTMGDCIMMVTKDMGQPVPFVAPDYAIPFDYEAAFKDKHRRIKQVKEGFWWVEVGDEVDIIANRENVREKLMAYFYGVWDYIKNSGNHPEAETIALDWIGSIPGRRESRRFMGDRILNQVDLAKSKTYDDAVAFGGWSFDEHNPGGIEDLSQPASFFHKGIKELYQIPYSALYSRNIENLSFSGRNISASHLALSSTRIIGTCSTMGQATGTAAAMCVRKGINPRDVRQNYITELQEQLLRDDAFIPKRPANDPKDLARKATAITASNTSSGNPKFLTDGVSRDRIDQVHHWEANGNNAQLTLEWEKPLRISQVEMKGETVVGRKMMMHKNPEKYTQGGQLKTVPPELIKKASVEALVNGSWKKVATIENNITRLMKTRFETVATTSIRINLEETWGANRCRLYEVRCYS